ncbi:GSCOCG00009581001-RA-CDS [Cotesia congregata]|nr:GSCOCG00009581001-RA-CDS [Cotesia congregata]
MENDSIKNMTSFQLHKVLENDVHQKKIAIKGRLNGRNAIIVLSRKSFSDDISELKEIIFNKETIITNKGYNENERHYELTLTNETNGVHATVKRPVTTRDFAQYQIAECWFIEETPELYENITLPYMKNLVSKYNHDWVYRILNGESEQEQTLHIDKDESTGYVLVKDSKWRTEEISEMHILAFTKQKLMTIRELNETHLPLLKKIKKEGTEIITKKYPDVLAEKLRICFVYLPSTFHLHVHFITDTAEAAETLLDRMHLLSTVINNIEFMPDYYQKSTIGIRYCSKHLFDPYQEYLEKKAAAIEPKTENDGSLNNENNYIDHSLMFCIEKFIKYFIFSIIFNFKSILLFVFILCLSSNEIIFTQY